MKRYIFHPICVACAIALVFAGSAPAQSGFMWVTAMGEWDTATNWDDGNFNAFVPLGMFGEFGIINNGGVATVSSAISMDPGGVVLAQGGGDSGTLHIQSGGTLTVIADEFSGVTGAVTAGGGGTGTLIVDRGGTLNAESLRVAGNAASAANLGGGAAGTAAVNITGNTTVIRQMNISSPDVALSTGSLDLFGSLSLEIGSGGNSTISVSGDANLGGTLNLDFVDGFTPGPSDTFDVIDAGAVNGNFTAVTSNVPPGPGLAYVLQRVAGGNNGTLARVGADVQLLLSVDRRTGASRIQNLTDDRSISINAYGVTSDSGVLDDSEWTPFSEGGPWSGNGSSTHVTELSRSGSRDIGPGAEIDLGNIYAFTPTELGETLEDLTFQYHVTGGDVTSGAIEYTGAHNDLVLVVDDNDGVFLQNQSLQDLTINAYAIVSESGGLNPTEWSSLSSGDASWTEANAATNHITELNRGGSLFLAAEGEAISLGMIHSPGAAQDLQFTFNIAGEGPTVGTVDYDQGVIEFMTMLLTGDYNGNGLVEQGDLDLVLLNWGDTLADPAAEGWVNDLPDGAIDQGELDGVLLNWGNGNQGLNAAGVPEPHTLAMVVFGMLILCGREVVRRTTRRRS